MWTPTTRQQHSRPVTRYQTDLTDAEWRVIAPHLPQPCATGRPREWPMREMMNAIFFVLRAGVRGACCRRIPPPDDLSLVRRVARRRTWERINHPLVMLDRERVGREASPSAAIIDSQSVKTTEAGGPRGYDAGKKINGRKRHAMVDTDGRGLVLNPSGELQDRDGGGPLLRASRRIFPFIERVFADSGYAGEKVAKATLIIEIVRKHPDQIGFAVNPRRWVVERFFAWIGRNRRLAKDFASTTLRNSMRMPSPVRLTTRPLCTAMVGSIRSLRRARSRASVRSSSEPESLLYPATSAARMAASFRVSAMAVPSPHARLARLLVGLDRLSHLTDHCSPAGIRTPIMDLGDWLRARRRSRPADEQLKGATPQRRHRQIEHARTTANLGKLPE